jgi:hypothetical protein
MRVIQAAVSVVSFDVQPARRHKHEERRARLDAAAERSWKDIAALDRAAVEEDPIDAETPAQVFVQGTSMPRGVAATVADEDRSCIVHEFFWLTDGILDEPSPMPRSALLLKMQGFKVKRVLLHPLHARAILLRSPGHTARDGNGPKAAVSLGFRMA